ncbi:MAG: amidohydrolase [Acetobacteraceae bacterium]
MVGLRPEFAWRQRAPALLRARPSCLVWHGTLMLVFQPAEETINGARAMFNDGLYTRFPRPDLIIAEHDTPALAAGTAGYAPGYVTASTTSIRIVLHGVSAHGSSPELGKDPVVAAAQLVLALQTIVSRETSPFDQAVVTVGSIQAGTKNNIIPDSATPLLTVRTYKEAVRQTILDSITRMAKGVALAAGLPADQPPTVQVSEYTKPVYNDPGLTARAVPVLQRALGAANVTEVPPVMGSEDFGYFGLDHAIPELFLHLGTVSAQALAASRASGIPLPSLHSSKLAPLPEPTIRTGVTAMTSLALALLH